MKTYLFCIFLSMCVALAACSDDRGGDRSELQALYDEIDLEMERSDVYQAEKEKRIDMLRDYLDSESDEGRRTEIIDRLIGEFESYISDSALHYVNMNLQRPGVATDRRRQMELLIKKADITSHAGLFADALAIMDEMSSAEMDSALLEAYYSTYCGIYQYQIEYTNESEYADKYERLRELYTDSVSAVTPPGSLNHLINGAPELVRRGKPDEAVAILKKHLDEYRSGTRQYSILASILANVYKTIGETDKYKRYLALSTISDIRGVVKENMAIRELATAIFEDGDIERANRYLKKSFDDANFFSARMRNAQSSRMLPVIDKAYNAKQHSLQRLLSMQVFAISALAIILVLAIVFILKQFKTVKRASRKVEKTNAELSELSEKLREANAELASMNAELKESNTIKEEYAGLFMEYCSSTISTLQHYHQSLRVLSAQGSKAALIKKLDSSEMIDKALKEFYSKFDEAILNIYPSFVGKFNALLRPGEEVALKPGELLNTELRVFALIRIGIDDSAKIAQFLRCSITTVYTYRSKMRKRAVCPDSFEADVMKIG